MKKSLFALLLGLLCFAFAPLQAFDQFDEPVSVEVSDELSFEAADELSLEVQCVESTDVPQYASVLCHQWQAVNPSIYELYSRRYLRRHADVLHFLNKAPPQV